MKIHDKMKLLIGIILISINDSRVISYRLISDLKHQNPVVLRPRLDQILDRDRGTNRIRIFLVVIDSRALYKTCPVDAPDFKRYLAYFIIIFIDHKAQRPPITKWCDGIPEKTSVHLLLQSMKIIIGYPIGADMDQWK